MSPITFTCLTFQVHTPTPHPTPPLSSGPFPKKRKENPSQSNLYCLSSHCSMVRCEPFKTEPYSTHPCQKVISYEELLVSSFVKRSDQSCAPPSRL